MFVLVESITVDASEDGIPPEAARNWYWAAVEVNMAIFSGMQDPALCPVQGLTIGLTRANDVYLRISANAASHCAQSLPIMHVRQR